MGIVTVRCGGGTVRPSNFRITGSEAVEVAAFGVLADSLRGNGVPDRGAVTRARKPCANS